MRNNKKNMALDVGSSEKIVPSNIGNMNINIGKKQKSNPIMSVINYFVKVFFMICIFIYKFIKYIWYGLAWPIIFVVILISHLFKPKDLNVEKLKKQSQEIYEKDKKREEKGKKSVLQENYKNENLNIKVEKKNLGYYLNLGITGIVSIPSNIKSWFQNNALVKQAKNKKALDAKTMLIDFSSEDENDTNKGKRVTWEYIAYTPSGKKKKGYFDAFSRVDVQSFLIGEGLIVYSIRTSKTIQILHGSMGGSGARFKNKDLIFLLAQLSTYLKSGIPLVDSLNILIRQVEKKSHKSVLRDLTYDLTVGESFSSALEKRGNSFPKLLINMVKASELTGELPEALDDMVNYYTEAEDARKEMISALTYPTIVFIFTLGVVTFVMTYVVPKFVDIYKSMEASTIPSFTKLVMNLSDFMGKNIIWILASVVVMIIILIYLYKNVKIIRTMFQWLAMHIPVLKEVIIYNEVTMFSKTFASLLSHNVYITDSMDILNKVTNNEMYKMMILDTVTNLARGEKISAAFKDQWAFPVPAYEMIVTGEKTGQLAEMMGKVSTYYQSLHKNTVSRIKALVEPILIIFLTFSVGAILLAVIIPMFNMYQQIQNLG